MVQQWLFLFRRSSGWCSSGMYWERERGEVGLSLNLSLLVMHRLRKGGRTLLLIPHGLQEHAEFALA